MQDLERAETELVAPPPSRTRAILGLVVSIVAVGGCVVWALDQETPALPDTPGHWALLLLGVLVYGLTILVRGWRWHEILRFADVRHERADSYGLVTVGYMGNNVLPARGGEVLRMFLLAERSSARRREVLGSILTERMLDAGALVALFALLTALNVADSPAGEAPAYIGAAALVLVLGAMIVYLRLRLSGRLQGFADRVRPVTRASRMLLTRGGAELAVATAAVWLAEAIIFWLVGASLGLTISVLESALVVVLASFFALIPAAPGYVGTYDAAVLFALGALDVPGNVAVGAALLFRFVIFVPVTIAGLILMVARYGGLRAALRRSARPAGQHATGPVGPPASPAAGSPPGSGGAPGTP
ncbi:MAG TPA: lysylphosphatidylglycerol synthase transmembrane domain-containing protein [Solirubrobacteraceae bacterium]|nr:lysylphosphatidylglycerol synthase transmembrane domain-containing protein [Solirubrobacteraceae bacterium]